jgi:hypothetical protein
LTIEPQATPTQLANVIVKKAKLDPTALSLAGLPFILPHVIEDFDRGIAQRVGLPPGVGAALLGAGLAVQMLGLLLAVRGARAGLVMTALAGAAWVVGALSEHGPELVATGLAFRDGPLSALWVSGIICTQGAAALVALCAILRR